MSLSKAQKRSLGGSGVLGLFLELVGVLFVLLADLVELPHVLEEVRRSLESNEELRLLAIASVVRSLNCDGLGSDFLECGVVVSNKVLRSDDASGDSVAKGVQLNCLVRLEVFLSQKDVEVGVFLD